MLTVQFREPVVSRYIFINPENNHVHLFMPIISGDTIGTDNTCQSTTALKQFFGKEANANVNKRSALHELARYQLALQHDISMITGDNQVKSEKQNRLLQIQNYINVLNQLQNAQEFNNLANGYADYPRPIMEIMKERGKERRESNGNLFSMLLRTGNPDHFTRTEAQVFSLERSRGGFRSVPPNDCFYAALVRDYETLIIASQDPLNRLKQAVIHSMQESRTINLEAIQRELARQTQALFGLNMDFTVMPNGRVVNKAYINSTMGVDEDLCLEEYVNTLIPCCAPNFSDMVPTSPFIVQNSANGKEKLSILTQFFLAEINIYCVANNLSHENFGNILDRTPMLQKQVTRAVKLALENGRVVEDTLLNFINTNRAIFSLREELNAIKKIEIKQKFFGHYAVIKESAHFDEFIIFDSSKNGRFLTHQSSICLDLADLINTKIPRFSSDFFKETQMLSKNLPRELSGVNNSVRGSYVLEGNALRTYLAGLIADEDNLDYAAELLLSTTENNQKVFQRLDIRAILLIKNSSYWLSLKNKISARITKDSIRTAFNQSRFMGDEAQILITHSMARSLYVGAVAKYGSNNCPQITELKEILQKSYKLEPHVRTVENSVGDGYVVACSNMQTVSYITRLIEQNRNKFYLSNELAVNIYREVKRFYGEGSAEYRHMQSLNNHGNIPNKMLQALRLLDITISSNNIAYPQEGRGVDGYILKVDPNTMERLETIQQYWSCFHLTAEMIEILYNYINQRGSGSEIAHLTNNPDPTKLTRTLELLGLPFLSVRSDGEIGYWVNMSSQSQKVVRNIVNGPIQVTHSSTVTSLQSGVSAMFATCKNQQVINDRMLLESTEIRQLEINVGRSLRRGTWYRLSSLCEGVNQEANNWEYGRSNYTGNLCFANTNYQIEFQPLGRIVIQNKQRQYAEVTVPNERNRVLRELCRCFSRLSQLTETPKLARLMG